MHLHKHLQLRLGSLVEAEDIGILEVIAIKDMSKSLALVTLLEVKNYPPKYEVEPDYALYNIEVDKTSTGEVFTCC